MQEGLITEYPVLEVDSVNIMDLNGGGYAFVGGPLLSWRKVVVERVYQVSN